MSSTVRPDQKILDCQKALGTYYKGKLDGIFGDQTKSAILAVLADIVKLKAQVKSCQDQIDSFTRELKDERTKSANLIGENGQLKASVNDLVNQVDFYKVENTNLGTERDKLKADFAGLISENIALKATIADLTGQIIELQKTNTIVEEIEELKTEVSELKDLLSALISDSLGDAYVALINVKNMLVSNTERLKDASDESTGT